MPRKMGQKPIFPRIFIFQLQGIFLFQRSPRDSNFAVGRLILTADDGGADGDEDAAAAAVVGNGGVGNGFAGVNWHFVDFTADAKQSSNDSET